MPGSSASGPKQGALSSGRRSSTKPAMRAKLAKAPAGSCDAELMLALEGNLEWSPTIALDVDVSKGLVTVKVDAEVTADMSALISAEAQCSAGLTRRLPSKPLKKMACAGYFCLLIMLQGVAKINVAGSVAGSAELGLTADFGMSAEVQVGIASGEADVKASSTKLRHQVGWQVAGSFDASVDVSMGPQLVVFPLPGVPVTIMPTVSAAVVAYGTVKYPNFVDALAVQHADEQTCAGAEVSVSGNADISGVGLPADLRLDTKEFEELLMGAVEDGAAKLLSLMAGGECSGPVGRAAQQAVGAAAELAGGAIGAAIPDLSVGLNVPVKSFLDQDLFCLKLARVGDCDALACP